MPGIEDDDAEDDEGVPASRRCWRRIGDRNQRERGTLVDGKTHQSARAR
jgi:hypothetical protein